MKSFRKVLLSASSALAIGLLAISMSPHAKAADLVASCESGLAGTVDGGGILGDADISSPGFRVDGTDLDIYSFFGEAAALYHWCDTGLNVQVDGAFHRHVIKSRNLFRKGLDSEDNNDRMHVGGVLFWRDPSFGVIGLDGSFLRDEIFGEHENYWRLGARAEYFVGEAFTFGAGAGLLNGEIFDQNFDGYDANLWARFYATQNLGLLARFDWASQHIDSNSFDLDTMAVTGEGEYLLPEHPLSIFAGARYAQQENSDGKFLVEIDHLQVYAGLKIYFGSGGIGLASQHRSNTLDNTSVPFERLPSNLFYAP